MHISSPDQAIDTLRGVENALEHEVFVLNRVINALGYEDGGSQGFTAMLRGTVHVLEGLRDGANHAIAEFLEVKKGQLASTATPPEVI